jgi:hypothetical protein|tara:strand:+ start:1117 stop:1377 length:261 start_codon:yes stop_codon:yes gene_type:complete
MMNTAALENIERYLVDIKRRTEEASEMLSAGIYDRSEGGIERSVERTVIGANLLEGYGSQSSVTELADRILRLVQAELKTREDRSA